MPVLLQKRFFLPVALIAVGLYLLWFLPRWEVFSEAVLLFDDYPIVLEGNHTAWLPAFRPVISGVSWVLDSLYPGYFESNMPKFFAGLGLVFSQLLLLRFFRVLNVPMSVGLSVLVLYSAHPILNDLTLWHTNFVHTFVIGFGVAGYLCVLGVGWGRWLCAALFMVLTVLGYQMYFAVPLMLAGMHALYEFLSGMAFAWRRYLRLGAAMAVGVVAYLLCSYITLHWLELDGLRGFVQVEQSVYDLLLVKVMGLLNLLLNIFYLPLAYYTQPGWALGVWKYLVVALWALGACVAWLRGWGLLRGVVLSSVGLSLVGFAGSPAWVASQTPESWRVTLPVWFALVVYLGLIFSAKKQEYGVNGARRALEYGCCGGVLVVAVLLMWPTRDDARMKLASFKEDQVFVGEIKAYWEGQGLTQDDYTVMFARPEQVGFEWDARIPCLSVSTTGVNTYSIFSAYNMHVWALLELNGFGMPEEGFLLSEGEFDARYLKPENYPRSVSYGGYLPVVVHDDALRRSVIYAAPHLIPFSFAD